MQRNGKSVKIISCWFDIVFLTSQLRHCRTKLESPADKICTATLACASSTLQTLMTSPTSLKRAPKYGGAILPSCTPMPRPFRQRSHGSGNCRRTRFSPPRGSPYLPPPLATTSAQLTSPALTATASSSAPPQPRSPAASAAARDPEARRVPRAAAGRPLPTPLCPPSARCSRGSGALPTHPSSADVDAEPVTRIPTPPPARRK